MDIYFTAQAEKQLGQLTKKEQSRVVKKVQWLSRQKDPLQFSKPIRGFADVYRFRVGKYRLICKYGNTDLFIVHIDKRDMVYKDF